MCGKEMEKSGKKYVEKSSNTLGENLAVDCWIPDQQDLRNLGDFLR